ncbi:MAG: Ada metal-binding domain-containing protein [Minisyncoccota bacterium]
MVKCKAILDLGVGEWGLFLALTLVVLASFGLGRLSALVDAKPLIELHTASLVAGQGMAVGGQYVASRSGSTYYFPWCSGALKIAPANERWFASEQAAKAAGYRPAKNCNGLAAD